MKNTEFYAQTPRLILRRPTEADASALAQARSTDFVTRYNLYQPCGADQIQKELEWFEHILLELKDEGRVIGCISVRDDDLRYHMDSKTLHAWLTRDMAYRGLMAEALEVVFAELFINRGHERIAIQIMSENQASIRLAEKLGFEPEGYLKRALRNSKDQVFDLALYSLDRETYLQKRNQKDHT